jgi:hypothetical protein
MSEAFRTLLENSSRLRRDGLSDLTALYERKRWRVVHLPSVIDQK